MGHFGFAHSRRASSAHVASVTPPSVGLSRSELRIRVETGDPLPVKAGAVEFIRIETVGPFLVVAARWPGAPNYDGRKVLVYYRATIKEIIGAADLDPHFDESRGPTVPIARFEPTEFGWEAARAMCETLHALPAKERT